MPSSSPALPRDPDELRAFAQALQAELYAKTLMIEKPKAQLLVLRRARFGRSSEKLDRDIEQLERLIGELEDGDAERHARTAATAPSSRPATAGITPHRGRQPLPDHLPREVVRHEPACICPECGGSAFSKLGEDTREVLDHVPSHFKVLVHVRPKMSRRACETIVQAPMPALPIEHGRPGPLLLAHVAVAKYCDHTPLHRQVVIYGRSGVELDRSTLADWIGQIGFLLTPLAHAIGRHAKAGAVIHPDDTPVPVLDPGRGRTKTGRLWVLVRDERPGADRRRRRPSASTFPTARASMPNGRHRGQDQRQEHPCPGDPLYTLPLGGVPTLHHGRTVGDDQQRRRTRDPPARSGPQEPICSPAPTPAANAPRSCTP